MDDPLAALTSAVELTCLRGLADAVAALLGDDPQAACEALARWRRLHRGELPWLAGRCWSALAPLGMAAPGDPDAVLLGRALVGAEADPARLVAALAACRARAGPPAAQRGPLPVGRPLADELWRRVLLSAVEDFWETLTRAYQRAHPALRTGRPADAESALGAAEEQLAPTLDQIATAARRIAGDADDRVVAAVRPPAGAPPVAAAAPGRPPAEAVEQAIVREHPVLPVVFLVVALLAAVGVLYAVAFGWPPQLP